MTQDKICAPTTPTKTEFMNNEELIRTLDRDHLLSVVELLSRGLMYPDDDFDELEGDVYILSDEVFEYCEALTDYQRLKLMQQIINTLVSETEKPTIEQFQLLLPLQVGGETTLSYTL